jgi:hypothetical protein
MKILGVAIGALLIGGAVIALSGTASANGGDTATPILGCMRSDANNYNPDATEENSSCTFDDADEQEKYANEIIDIKQQEEEDAKQAFIAELRRNCSDLYTAQGIRTHDETQKVMRLQKTGNTNCVIHELDVQIYTDKEYYIVGETVNIYVGKRFRKKKFRRNRKWVPWSNNTVSEGESLGFNLGVWDEYGKETGDDSTITLREFNSALGGQNANDSLPTGLLDNGGANGGMSYSWQKFSINTANLNIVEPLGFNIKGQITRGSGGKYNLCTGTINKTQTKTRAITIFPRACSKTYLTELGIYEAETNNYGFSAELTNSYHSFIDNWM